MKNEERPGLKLLNMKPDSVTCADWLAVITSALTEAEFRGWDAAVEMLKGSDDQGADTAEFWGDWLMEQKGKQG